VQRHKPKRRRLEKETDKMTKARSSSSRSKQGEMKKGEKRMKEEDFKSEIKEKKEVRRLPSWILHPS
jgi:hypothetical protein